jgi:serine/threonine protein kinase
VENGSLGQTIKAFGKLNERLVATYITKILEGLHYLHKSHVVHCDLKAANILTTKTGNVKLSDFGVSLNLHAKALDEIKNDVAGTPNWSKLTFIMTNCQTNWVKHFLVAPEVIQLQGPSPASDIWSLGCTAIELLTGHPPYHEIHNGLSGTGAVLGITMTYWLTIVSVMFRIVEDDLPPIPPECSPQMEDFLKQCFKKDPKERPDAETLFEHPWLKSAWAEHRVSDSYLIFSYLTLVGAPATRFHSFLAPCQRGAGQVGG